MATVTVPSAGAGDRPMRVTTTAAPTGVSFGDADAATTPAKARARILAIFKNRNLPSPEPAKLAAMVDRAVASKGTYFNTIRAEPKRYLPAAQGGFLSEDGTMATVDTDGDGKLDASAADAERRANGEDARLYFQNLLAEYDFDEQQIAELLTLVDQGIRKNWSDERIIQELRGSGTYQSRFAGMALRRENGLAAINEGEYIALERGYKQIFRKMGLPEGFHDSYDDFVTYIGNDISLVEMEERVADGFVAAKNAPTEVRQALAQFYGIGNSDAALAAYYLDPDKGLEAIQREFRAASIAGISSQTGFGMVDKSQAERLGGLGISDQEARSGFSELAQSKELFIRGAGEVGAQTLDRDEQLDAQFERDSELLERIRKQRERRLSAFMGADAGAVLSSKGMVGLSSSTS